jgi:hypothetical protein
MILSIGDPLPQAPSVGCPVYHVVSGDRAHDA